MPGRKILYRVVSFAILLAGLVVTGAVPAWAHKPSFTPDCSTAIAGRAQTGTWTHDGVVIGSGINVVYHETVWWATDTELLCSPPPPPPPPPTTTTTTTTAPPPPPPTTTTTTAPPPPPPTTTTTTAPPPPPPTTTTTTVAPNDPPVARDDDGGTLLFGESVSLEVVANDKDESNFTLVVTVAESDIAPSLGTIELKSDRVIVYTAGSEPGEESFTYTVTDDVGQTDTGTVTLIVEAPNLPPVVADATVEVVAGDSVSYAVYENVEDEDVSTLQYAVVDAPSIGTFVLDEGMLVYDTAGVAAGEYSLTYSVTDDAQQTATAVLTFNVTEPVEETTTTTDSSTTTSALTDSTVAEDDDTEVVASPADTGGDSGLWAWLQQNVLAVIFVALLALAGWLFASWRNWLPGPIHRQTAPPPPVSSG